MFSFVFPDLFIVRRSNKYVKQKVEYLFMNRSATEEE